MGPTSCNTEQSVPAAKTVFCGGLTTSQHLGDVGPGQGCQVTKACTPSHFLKTKEVLGVTQHGGAAWQRGIKARTPSHFLKTEEALGVTQPWGAAWHTSHSERRVSMLPPLPQQIATWGIGGTGGRACRKDPQVKGVP